MRITVLTLLIGLCTSFAFAQQTGSVHVKNATVITVTGEILENTDLLVRNGKITGMGQNLSTPSGV
ncbi:MAG TPA: amidohydrolase, partial [Bacteroidetes bacterium]|nr:amidohydrolase [Bacteroidota bacterium]